MSPQVKRNTAARDLYAELSKRYPELDREWLRAMVNRIGVEELKLVRRDILAEVRRGAYYHGGTYVRPEDTVISVATVLKHLDQRISGEPV